MQASLSTWCRAPSEPPKEWCDRAERLGATEVVLDGRLEPAWADGLMQELAHRRQRLRPVAVEAPCPRPRARPPLLASSDREERRAALCAATETISRAAELGATPIVVALGFIESEPDAGWNRLVRAFSRGELATAEIDRLAEMRAKMTAQALDLARFGLEPLLNRAITANVQVALVNRARWYEIPDEPERAALFAEFQGAPLCAWHDTAAAHLREVLGFGRHADILATFAERTAGIWLTDAAGLMGGLPWGLGEVNRSLLNGLQATPVRTVHAAPSALDSELAAALSAG